MRVRAYVPDDAEAWDRFCAGAPAATFLHSRRYLAYHGERFVDRSLVIENDDGRWLGVLPAAQAPGDPTTIVSHPGLTYGGLLHAGGLRGEDTLRALEAACAHYAALGARRLRYKPVPHIWHAAPMQDDLYALFRLGAQRERCDLSACITLASPLPTSERRRRALRKAQRSGLRLAQGAQWIDALWPVLEDNLRRRHDVAPVHSADEMLLLAQRFPEQIRVCVALAGDEDGAGEGGEKRVVAGTVLYITTTVAHTQYIASSEQGQALSALDLVFDSEIRHAREHDARFFSFGINTEDAGRRLNEGLHRFKCEFGAGGVVHEHYSIALG